MTPVEKMNTLRQIEDLESKGFQVTQILQVLLSRGETPDRLQGFALDCLPFDRQQLYFEAIRHL